MDEKLKKWLFDVLKSIQEIEDYASQANRNFNIFKENRMMKRAIERNLEILGEAINRILQVEKNIEITNLVMTFFSAFRDRPRSRRSNFQT